MCAAVSTYAHACAAKGVILQGWMDSDPCGENFMCLSVYMYGMRCKCECEYYIINMHDFDFA